MKRFSFEKEKRMEREGGGDDRQILKGLWLFLNVELGRMELCFDCSRGICLYLRREKWIDVMFIEISDS